MEVYNTVILSVATLLVTWCSYQSTLWDGIQTFRLAESNINNRQAQAINMITIQHQAMDQSIVIGFVEQVMDRKKDKMDFSLQRIRPELANVIRAWIALRPAVNPDAPPHPLAMKEYGALFEKDMAASKELLKQADKKWVEAQEANKYSDRYSLLTVIFSMVMFLGAIATKASQVRISYTLVMVSGFICIAMLVLMFLFMPLARE